MTASGLKNQSSENQFHGEKINRQKTGKSLQK
jgi:hypothetical protein